MSSVKKYVLMAILVLSLQYFNLFLRISVVTLPMRSFHATISSTNHSLCLLELSMSRFTTYTSLYIRLSICLPNCASNRQYLVTIMLSFLPELRTTKDMNMKEGSSYIHKLSQCISLPVIDINYCFSHLRSLFTLSTKL